MPVDPDNDNESIEFSQSYDPNPPPHIVPSFKINRKLFEQKNDNSKPSPFINTSINVLSFNKNLNKYVVNEKYQQYLMEDASHNNSIIVSMVGGKRVGKSFLTDCLISTQTGKTCRALSKTRQPGIHSHPFHLDTKNGNNLIFLDCSSQPSTEIFLWLYFISSVIVYNVENSGKGLEEIGQFRELLSYVRRNFQGEKQEFPRPKLVIAVRDFEGEDCVRNEYVQMAREFELFQPQISVNKFPYPGSANIPQKQITDIHIKQLTPAFLQQVSSLLKSLSESPQKILKNNYINSKLLSLTLEASIKSINSNSNKDKNKNINCDKIWNQIAENLSIGFYNYYLECYEKELTEAFGEEKPVDRYALFKRLSSIRRNLNKKVQNFEALSDDPIFSRYQQRLNYIIKQKQKLISTINAQKSKQKNQKYCQEVLKEINNDNCDRVVQEYLKTELNGHKSDVLLQKFENKLMEHRARSQRKKSGKKNSIQNQIQNVEQEITQLERSLKEKQTASSRLSLSLKSSKIVEKQNNLKTLNQKYKDQKQRMSSANEALTKEYNKLQQERQKITQLIDKDEEQIKLLRQKREQQMRNVTKDLEARYKTQQDKLKELQDRLRDAKKVKVSATPPPPKEKDKGCCCAVM